MTPLVFDQPLRFLVVDDKPFIRQTIHGILQRAKARSIKEAESGEDALKVLAQFAFDCILCDWNMAPVNGLELLRAVRSGEAACDPKTCFVLITSTSDRQIVNLAIVLDVNGYLAKPVSSERLVTTVKKALAKPISLKSPKYYDAVELVTPPKE